MDQETYNAAFLKGFTKRAEEYGIEKSALVGTIAGTAARIIAPLIGQHYLTKGIGAFGARKGAGTLGRQAKKLHTLLTESPMISRNLGDNLKGQAAFMGTAMLADKLVNPIVDPIANRLERRDLRG
jgi:hypothetical protein